MSCIVYQTNKKTGVKYAYESVSYWDPEKKQPRSRRKYVGKVDPETGEIIYTNKGNQAASSSDTEAVRKLQESLRERDLRIAELEEELASLSKKHESLLRQLRKLVQQSE